MKTSLELFGVECGPGWESLYKPLFEAVEAEGGSVFQVKEKFGGLRFYAGGISEELQKKIQLAEIESYNICDVCGKPGKLRGKGWMMTRCEEHDADGK